MTITRYETLMLKIEELAKDPEKNEEILDRLSNKLAAQKFYLDNIDVAKVEESIKSGELSYNEYKVLKNVLEEKKLYEKNSEKIEEVINSNYENIDAKKRMITRKSLKTAGIIAAGVLLAVGVMSCSKKQTANSDKYHKSIEDRNERFEDPNKNNNNNNNENKNNTNDNVVDNKTNNDSKSENTTNESNKDNNKSSETKNTDNKDDKKNNESKDNSSKDDKKTSDTDKNSNNNNNKANNAVNNNSDSNTNTSNNNTSTNNTDNGESNNSENTDNNNSTISYEVDEKKEAEIDKMIEQAGEVTYVEKPSDGKNNVVVEEPSKDINLPVTEENIAANEKDVITYEIDEDNTEIIEVKPEDKEDSYTEIEGPTISLEDLPIEENEEDEITYDIFTGKKEAIVETKKSVVEEEPKIEEKIIEVKEETKTEIKEEVKKETKTESKEETTIEETKEEKIETKEEVKEEKTEIVEETKEEVKIEIPAGLIDLIDLVEDDENEITYDIFEESTISKSL